LAEQTSWPRNEIDTIDAYTGSDTVYTFPSLYTIEQTCRGFFAVDSVVRELAFHVMVERGLADSDAKRTISNEDMARRIRLWQK
jgi:hypothetical protein